MAITGGNSGIGAATARAFAAEGARVAICARRDAEGRAVEAAIRADGGEAWWAPVDVRDAAQVERWIGAVAARWGQVNVLFNNAGIFMTPGAIEEITVANFADMMQTNVAGVFHGMKYALPRMRAQGGGVIINMASVAGHRGFANTAHYNASKHAVIGLTKAAAVAHARHGIRVVSISPLAVDTPMLRESFAHQGLQAEAVAASLVTPRIMRAEEMAASVMMLADPRSVVTGIDLDVTDGQLA
ncbi:SDR family NAD(P)-dependent oxidoreductase [Elioraea rosea]|uniref:SDR family NAD(P)-dependent oxidoreductase n=1 Tax=Elioraea rosea TaxID=2492390 RepID=UPI001EF69C72|nr:SDR family oxidoreductase [Elioraea rosea]